MYLCVFLQLQSQDVVAIEAISSATAQVQSLPFPRVTPPEFQAKTAEVSVGQHFRRHPYKSPKR